MSFFVKDVIVSLDLVEGEPIIIVINGVAVKDYPRNTISLSGSSAEPLPTPSASLPVPTS